MEKQPEGGGPPTRTMAPRPRTNLPAALMLLLVVFFAAYLLFRDTGGGPVTLDYGAFREELGRNNIAQVMVKGQQISGEFKTPPEFPDGKKDRDGKPVRLPARFSTTVPPYVLQDPSFDQLLREKVGTHYAAEEPPSSTGLLIVLFVLPTLLFLIGLWFVLRRTRDPLGGGLLSTFIKSPVKRYESGERPVTFEDVAGLESVKHELQEIVDFLKNPAKFQRLGGQIPKGVLLNGPPGTGKTLLARAVAGEAGVPFFSINGSEFIQMFVGVGASRVRDLFSTAKEHAPSILFIDEIDAVGRHRGAGLGGGHDEREQTLNQILSEMDGFSQNESVIVMAATNRPDVLDPALLRPGRFDRHVTVDRPSMKGRVAIFRVHMRNVPLAEDVDLDSLAASTAGLTGADIRNLVNEAALWATREGKDRVAMADFDYARDKVLMGAKREEILRGKEKQMTAYHEAGHALLVWLVPCGDRLHKVSIIPRGRSLGATQLFPDEDRVNVSESELHTRLAFLLGGRSAEKLVFNEFTAGAEDDLKRATQLARRMVTHWGMSERLGPMAFRGGEEHPFLGREMAEPREFSEHTAQVIDEEVSRILRTAAERALELLQTHRGKLDALARALEEEEELTERQVEELIGQSAYTPLPPSPLACAEEPWVGDGQIPGP